MAITKTAIVKASARNRNDAPIKAASSFRRKLLVLLVLLPVLIIVALQWYSIYSNEKVLLRQARIILQSATDETLRHSKSFINLAVVEARNSASLMGSTVVNPDDRVEVEKYFFTLLGNHPEFTGISLAKEDGSYLYVSRDDTDLTSYRVKSISSRNGQRTTDVWTRKQFYGEKQSQYFDQADTFDPRIRPWYIQAVEQRGLVWTDPYVFFTVKRFGVTTAIPVIGDNGEILGVVGIDLELAQLSAFLDLLQISHSGAGFISTQDGMLVGSTQIAEDFSVSAGSDESNAPNLYSNKYPFQQAAFKAAFSGEENLAFKFDDKEYLVESLKIEISDDHFWWIVTYADQNDFLLAIRENEEQKLLFAVMAVILSIMLGVLLSSSASKPVGILEGQANTDQLTGLYNRRVLQHGAQTLITRAITYSHSLSFVFIDIDHFKKINDSYGHDVGDEIMKFFARRITSQLRTTDLFARFGGEEFVILMPNMTEGEAALNVDRMRKAISQPYQIDELAISVTFSAGVASLLSSASTYDSVLKLADQAMYKAKKDGRDRVVRSSLIT